MNKRVTTRHHFPITRSLTRGATCCCYWRSTLGNAMIKTLYYGDNLHVLREHMADESVDLIYLDPPFNTRIREVISFAYL